MKPARAVAIIRDLAAVQCIGYVRVSTDAQANEDRTSLADQRRAVTARALKRGATVGEWFEDDGYSGASVEKRPALQSLLASCERHPRPPSAPGLVLALNDSRWGRFPDPEESGYWRFHLARLGWVVRFAEGDDVEDGVGRSVVRLVASAQASEYRENLRRNSQRGMRGSTERGYWTREAPFGYRRAVVYPVGRARVLEPRQRKADDERVALVPHEKEARVVRDVFERFASGQHSIRTLARAMKLSRRAVQAILLNPAHCGDVLSGRRCADQSGQYGKRDAHEPIVTRELFTTVQARLAANRATPRSPNSDYLMSGLVTCADCGKPYTGGGLGSRRADGTRTKFYKCSSGDHDGPRCGDRIGCVSKHLLEGAVIETLHDELTKPATQRRITAAVDRYLASSGTAVTDESSAVRKDLAKLEKQRDRLVTAIADGTLEQREAAPQLTRIRTEIDAATATIQRLAFRQRRGGATQDERNRLIALASDFAAAITKLRGPELRDLIRPWLSSATFDKNSRVLTLAIRRVPAIGVFVPAHRPGRAGQKQDVIVRRMVIGGRWR